MKRLLAAVFSSALVFAGEPVTLETPTGAIYGTLELPSGDGPFPVVLIHAGSGPTDRDGNTPQLPGKNNSLKLLAEAMSAQGIASLRYDKRGIAASAKAALKEEDLRFENYIDDAVSWGRQLRQDKRFGKVIYLGHSEGALILLVAAQKLPADGYISVSGAGRPAGVILLEQLRAQAPPDLMKQVEQIVASLNQGHAVANTPAVLAALFRPSVQPYLISWFRYDPAAEMGKLNMPSLILQGDTDVQVQITDARLLKAGQRAASLVIVGGMNHVLKSAPTDPRQQAASYSDPSLPVVPMLINEVVAFIQSVARQ
jgi:pimeloyl-ACP methyl ester carboxylesterase